MSFSINTNVTSLQAQQNLAASAAFQAKTINEVTSGLRIVSSGDDAAGLAVANSLRSDQATLNQGIQNANNGLSTLQTIDGGINNISTLLDRATTLAAQSASGTFTGDRGVLNSEYQSVLGEINRQAQAIGLDTGGAFAKSLSVFVGGGTAGNGATAVENGTIGIDLSKSAVDGQALGLSGTSAVGVKGTNISDGGTTTVANILAANGFAADGVTASGLPNANTTFSFTGAGFSGAGSGANAQSLTVSLTGVNSTATLVTAINSAISLATTNASGGSTGTAFANAGITASISTDATGKQQLSFSSSTAAFQVQAGDQTANALLGNFNPTAANTATGLALTSTTTGGAATAQTVTGIATTAAGSATAASLVVTGGALAAAVTYNFTANQTVASELAQLQDTSSANGKLLAAAGISVSQAGGAGGAITFSSKSATALTATTGASPADGGLGLITATNTAVDGVASAGITFGGSGAVIRVQGSGTATPIDLTFASTDSAASVATSLTTATTANAIALKNAGIVVTQAASGNGALVFTSASGGSVNVSASGDTGNLLGLGSFSSGAATFNSINGITAGSQGITGAGAVGNTTNAGQTLQISVAGGTAINLSTGALTAAADATTQGTAIALALNNAIAADATLTAAGLKVTSAAGTLTIGSNNGTSFRLNATSLDSTGVAGTLATSVGFGAGGTASTAASAANTLASQSNFTSGGASATPVYAFNPTANQTVGFTAFDASGVSHTTSISLVDNTATASSTNNALTLDQAVTSINKQLQGSGDTTLNNILAVKADTTSATGVVTQGIQFISSLSSFSVTLGAAGTTASQQGIGTAAQQGAAQTSTAGSRSDVSTSAGAAIAVNALASAIKSLGSAQANVGKGENILNYAVALAQTQVTNEAAAESRIRDADLAAQAANLSKAQILVQAGTAALAQANSAPQAILSLLK